jgi:hypothetical protein
MEIYSIWPLAANSKTQMSDYKLILHGQPGKSTFIRFAALTCEREAALLNCAGAPNVSFI